MYTNNINNNNQFVVFQDINEEYAWVNYEQFKLLMMKKNGYVNVTKMCDNGNKKFFNWRQNNRSKELIKCLSNELGSLGIPRDVDYVLKNTMTGENDLRGTYAHPDLVLDIACWLSGEFYLKASKIVREYFNKQEREKLEELHRNELNKLECEKRELQNIRERLEKEFEKADDERKKANEERKRSEIRYIEMCKKYDIQYDNIGELKDLNIELRENVIELKETNVGLKDNIVGLEDSVIELKENTNILISNQEDLLES